MTDAVAAAACSQQAQGADAPAPVAQAPVIEATSQLTRFHDATLEVTANRSLVLQQVNLSVSHRQLLADAVLDLQAGRRYGLIGKNGVGKSTLLKVLGSRTLVGFPKWITCVHVAQEAPGSQGASALEHVVASDARAAQLQREIELLEGALASGDAQDVSAAVASLRATDARAEADAALFTAAQRSRRRGLVARKAAIAADERAAVAAAVAAEASVQAIMSQEEGSAAAAELLNERYTALEEQDPDVAEGKARQILSGLGFSKAYMEAPLATLSGGWRMRAALAAALFAAPDILCLDEPTNHLDLEATLWLQEFLVGPTCENQTLLVVSHDRAFLNAVCSETIEFKDKTLRYFGGTYDAYMEAKRKAHLAATRQQSALDKQKKHIESSIAEAERSARVAGDDKKLAQAASRRKKLEERHGLEKNAKGHHFKLNRDYVGYFESRRPNVVLETFDKPFEFSLPEPSALRGVGPDTSILQLRHVSYTYHGATSPVLYGVTLDILSSSRLALVGANGAGKSTLMRLLAGELEPTPPPPGFVPPKPAQDAKPLTKKQQAAAKVAAVSASQLPTAQAAAAAIAAGGAAAAGSVERVAALRTGVFGQHCIDELNLPETALDRLKALYPGQYGRDLEARNYLGSFGLGPHSVQPLSSLSGGQKARAALALMFAAHPHLLLLDEPTNHLDLDTVEALARALRTFKGAVVVASHDVRFVNELLTGTTEDDGEGGGGGGGTGAVDPEHPGDLYVVGGGAAKRWTKDGGVEAYAGQVLAAVQKQHGALLLAQR